MPIFSVSVKVEVPALDRLLDFLETRQQAQVDTFTAALTNLSSRLNTTNQNLNKILSKENT